MSKSVWDTNDDNVFGSSQEDHTNLFYTFFMAVGFTVCCTYYCCRSEEPYDDPGLVGYLPNPLVSTTFLYTDENGAVITVEEQRKRIEANLILRKVIDNNTAPPLQREFSSSSVLSVLSKSDRTFASYASVFYGLTRTSSQRSLAVSKQAAAAHPKLERSLSLPIYLPNDTNTHTNTTTINIKNDGTTTNKRRRTKSQSARTLNLHTYDDPTIEIDSLMKLPRRKNSFLKQFKTERNNNVNDDVLADTLMNNKKLSPRRRRSSCTKILGIEDILEIDEDEETGREQQQRQQQIKEEEEEASILTLTTAINITTDPATTTIFEQIVSEQGQQEHNNTKNNTNDLEHFNCESTTHKNNKTKPANTTTTTTIYKHRRKADIFARTLSRTVRGTQDYDMPTTCDICLMDYEVGEDVAWSRNDQCIHAFHKECITDWLLRNPKCPLCRNEYIVPKTSENNHNNNHNTAQHNEEEEEEDSIADLI